MADNPAQETAKAIEEAKQRMKELNDEIKRLGGSGFSDINAMAASFGNNLVNATKQVKLMEDEVDDLKNSFGNIADTLKSITSDIMGSTKTSTLLTRNFSKLEDLSRKIQQHKNEESVLSVKELKSIAKKVEDEKKALDINAQQARSDIQRLSSKQDLSKAEQDELKKLTDYSREIASAQADNLSYYNQIVKLSQKEVENEAKIQKTLGVTGMAFKGITGALQKIGVDSKYFDGINDKL